MVIMPPWVTLPAPLVLLVKKAPVSSHRVIARTNRLPAKTVLKVLGAVEARPTALLALLVRKAKTTSSLLIVLTTRLLARLAHPGIIQVPAMPTALPVPKVIGVRKTPLSAPTARTVTKGRTILPRLTEQTRLLHALFAPLAEGRKVAMPTAPIAAKDPTALLVL